VESELARRTWPEITAGGPITVVVPIGSCEQHGPHLPLATDTLIAQALSESVTHRLAALAGTRLVAPALSITASGEHQGFAGTLSIGTDALEMVIIELVRSASWADAVVLVNGHGGNAVPIGRATERLRAEGHRIISWWPPDTGLVEVVDLHAGIIETSIMLALDPGLVGDLPGPDGVGADIELLRRSGVAAVSASGVLGDPSGASASLGRRVLEHLGADLAHRVTALIGSPQAPERS
jgi:creatinine amidohydrolase